MSCMEPWAGRDAATDRLLGVQVDGDDQTVETQHLGKDQYQDHADEETRLLRGASHTGVTDDADSKTGR